MDEGRRATTERRRRRTAGRRRPPTNDQRPTTAYDGRRPDARISTTTDTFIHKTFPKRLHKLPCCGCACSSVASSESSTPSDACAERTKMARSTLLSSPGEQPLQQRKRRRRGAQKGLGALDMSMRAPSGAHDGGAASKIGAGLAPRAKRARGVHPSHDHIACVCCLLLAPFISLMHGHHKVTCRMSSFGMHCDHRTHGTISAAQLPVVEGKAPQQEEGERQDAADMFARSLLDPPQFRSVPCHRGCHKGR